jgi:NAD-dependent deacetylase
LPIEQVAGWLRASDRITVLSGAGLSRASGIPTYRDEGGLWTQAGTARFSSVEELQRDPTGFRAFWADRRRELLAATPNAGHMALAQLQRLKPEATLITQNVDGLLQRAGAVRVLEVHGSLARERCDSCGAVSDAPTASEQSLAACPSCGAASLRPDVVMFGERLDHRVDAEADYKSKTAEVFLLVGTSAVVRPASGWAEKAVSRGARLVIINLQATPLDPQAHVVMRQPTEEVLPRLVERLRP